MLGSGDIEEIKVVGLHRLKLGKGYMTIFLLNYDTAKLCLGGCNPTRLAADPKSEKSEGSIR